MSTHPLRKIIQKTGFDVLKFRPKPNPLEWLKDKQIKTVLDVGANVGQFAKEIREFLPETKIISFEPLSDCFHKLTENMKDDNSFKAFNFALGEKDEVTTIHHSDYSPSSSILHMAHNHKSLFPHTKESRPEQITIKKLDDLDLITTEKLEQHILLKIDTQGFEDKVLKGAEKFLEHVTYIIIETSYIELYEKQPLFADIYSILTHKEFIYKGGLQQKMNGKTGQIISEDSLFVKEN
ncbi:MAG: FkbM family methyltransferase [bacterium]